jgi:hypothetical protein
MSLRPLIHELDALLSEPAVLQLEAVLFEALEQDIVSPDQLEHFVEVLGSDYLVEAGFLSNLKKAATKAIKRITKKVVRGARKTFAKVTKAITGKPAKAACKPGEKMVFGACRVVKNDSHLADDETGEKSKGWYTKSANAHRALAKHHSGELSKSWNNPDHAVPHHHLQKSMHHASKAQELDKMSRMTPAERKQQLRLQKLASASSDDPEVEISPATTASGKSTSPDLKGTTAARRKSGTQTKATKATKAARAATA